MFFLQIVNPQKQVNEVIDRAIDTSPTQGNGYGLLLAVLLFLVLGGVAYFIWRQRIVDKIDENERNEQKQQREEHLNAVKDAMEDVKRDNRAAFNSLTEAFETKLKEFQSGNRESISDLKADFEKRVAELLYRVDRNTERLAGVETRAAVNSERIEKGKK